MRRGRVLAGGVAALTALFFAVPAIADTGGPATDQGYPSPTQPAPGPGEVQPGTVPPSVTPVPTTGGTQVVTLTPSSGTLGAQKTLNRTAPAVNRPTRAAVAPTRVTRTAGGLPFTGAQLTIFAVVGVALILGGLLLRSTGRSRPQA